jgi:hypothetical protein
LFLPGIFGIPSSLTIARRAVTFSHSLVFADELAFLCATEISLPLIVKDTRPRVDPHNAVAWTRHTRRYLVLRRLSEGMAADSKPDDK